jgi:hypothetical protein
LDALLGGEFERVAPLLAPHATAPARLGVYRNNVRANFIDSLHSSFPAIWRLVGEAYFRQIAGEFHRLHPSRSGDLLHVGHAFPGYLAERHHADEYRYLGDIARLEWLCQESLLAAEHSPLDLERLRRVTPSAYDDLRFQLHPAVRLFESPYPALRIWQANVASDAEPEVIDLASGPDCVAVMRQRLQLKFHPLSRGEQAFLNALQAGTACGAAIEQAGACDDEFDASAALQRFVAAEIIVDFR